jgi:hypothetical protein
VATVLIWVLGTRAMGWFGLSYTLEVVATATTMVNVFRPKYLHDPIG